MRRLSHLWKEHRLLCLAFAAAVLVTSLFSIRAVFGMMYWSDPRHQDREFEPWMTPRYISMSYQLPRNEVLGALGISEGELYRPITLRKISKHTGVDILELEASVEETARRFREASQ